MFMHLSQVLMVASLLTLGACSFQKDPGGKTKLVTETVLKEVKLKEGLTEEDLIEKIKSSGLPLPDLIQHATLVGGKEMAKKLLSQASNWQLNEVGNDGDTVLMIGVKADDDNFVMEMLLRGASPYVPSRGTSVTPLDLIKDKGSDWDYVRSQLPYVEEKFAQGGYNVATELFIHDYVNNRFPMTKAVGGHKPHIYHFIEAADYLRQNPCGDGKSLRPLLEVIEKLEGPIKVPDTFDFVRAMVIAEDRFAFEFFKDKLGRDLTKEERLDLIGSVKKTSLNWLFTLHHLLNIQGDEELALMNDLIKKVVEKAKQDDVLKTMHRQSIYLFFFNNYPNAFISILGKINGMEVLVTEMEPVEESEHLPPYDSGETESLYRRILEDGSYDRSCFKDE